MTDPDSRAMRSQAKGTAIVGYNVQAAVDKKHHLIVAHEVTRAGGDRAQLTQMATAAREAMGKPRLQALADRVTSAVRRSRPERQRASRRGCSSQ